MMKPDYGNDDLSALKAKTEAQKIAFGPMMFQAARALRELGILKVVSKAGRTGAGPEEISEKTGISRYGVEVLLDAGLSMGIVMLRNGNYVLTKTGFFLLSDTLTSVNMEFVHHTCYNAMFYLLDSVRTGRPEGLKVLGDWDTIYQGLTQLTPEVTKSWFDFDHFYSDQVFGDLLPIVFEDKPRKVMDVGGNTGKWAKQCLEYDPEVEVTIVDLPRTLVKALELASDKPYRDRLNGHAMDVLDQKKDFPKGYDVIWMSQFLDCFSKEEILSILQRAARAMQDNASLFILELFWDRQLYEASTYSLNATSLYFTCIANGNSRMYHSADFIELVEKAGLKVEYIKDHLGISHTLLKCIKR
jgi:ubiquinone/menaquinone biosynthesis C-methylase UbiE